MPSGTSVGQLIVSILSEYKRALPIDFVAKVVGRTAQEIRPELQNLEERGAIHCDDDRVQLLVKK
jgi:predicted transcriptional regulator